MDIELRLEQLGDHHKTEEIMREASWNYYAPGCYEHYSLHIMRNSPNFVKELDFVVVWEGRTIGSAVRLKSLITADNGNKCEVLSMGPIAVLPKYQRMDVGKALIAHACSVAAEMGYHAILLYGDSDYYSKAGFVAVGRFNIRTSENKYTTALHVYLLWPDALASVTGQYYEDEVYSINIAKAEEFDRSSPKKERITGVLT